MQHANMSFYIILIGMWVGLGYSVNPERCKITLKMHLNTSFICS